MKKNRDWIPWLIVAMAFIATALCFLDRQVLSISIIKIKEDIPISDIDYEFIVYIPRIKLFEELILITKH